LSALTDRKFFAVTEISGPLLFLKSVSNISYGELVEVTTPQGEERTAQVIDAGEDITVVQVFEGTSDLDIGTTATRFTGETIKLPVSTEILGRVFTGGGKVADGGPEIIPEDYWDIHGAPINPYSRAHPTDFIQTGISAITTTQAHRLSDCETRKSTTRTGCFHYSFRGYGHDY
jgi:V/A-type H+-transporting ATPase subunit B